MVEGETGRLLTATAGATEESGADVRPGGAATGGASPAKSLLQSQTRQEQEAAMGQKPRQGRGLPAGRETRTTISTECEAEGKAVRPTEWRPSTPK